MLIIQSGTAKRFRKYSITMAIILALTGSRGIADAALVCRPAKEVGPPRFAASFGSFARA